MRALMPVSRAASFMVLFLAAAAGFVPTAAECGGPDVPAPTCVPVPGMPCPGSVTRSSSSSYSTTYSTSTSKPHKPSNNELILKGLQNSIDQMFKPNPETLRRIKQIQMEGDQAQEAAVMSQQSAEDSRRLKAQRDGEAARQRQLQELNGALSGMPGPDLENLREGASSGFDTQGGLIGILPGAPPSVPFPTQVAAPVDRPIPPEKLTPEIKAIVTERDALRAKKQQLEADLAQYETKRALTAEDSQVMMQLREDLAKVVNQENYLTFSVNESLDALPSAALPGNGANK